MIRLILLCILAWALSIPVANAEDGCDEIKDDGKGSRRTKSWPLDPDYAKTPPVIGLPLLDGKVVCKVNIEVREQLRYFTRYEIGEIGGHGYRIFPDGSGRIMAYTDGDVSRLVPKTRDASWQTHCRVDAMDDTRSCTLNRGNLTIGLDKSGAPFAFVGHSHYPGTGITLRIGDEVLTSVVEVFSPAQSARIVELLQAGEQKVVSRYQEWPYKGNKDEVFDSAGFGEAWTLLGNIHRSAGQ